MAGTSDTERVVVLGSIGVLVRAAERYRAALIEQEGANHDPSSTEVEESLYGLTAAAVAVTNVSNLGRDSIGVLLAAALRYRDALIEESVGGDPGGGNVMSSLAELKRVAGETDKIDACRTTDVLVKAAKRYRAALVEQESNNHAPSSTGLQDSLFTLKLAALSLRKRGGAGRDPIGVLVAAAQRYSDAVMAASTLYDDPGSSEVEESWDALMKAATLLKD